MKLPHGDKAAVPRAKVQGYLLSLTHRSGRSKAAFFARFGFRSDSWQVLADALVRHAAENEVAEEEESPFGTRYVIDGIMRAADGRKQSIRSLWFIEKGAETPRFVTAHPLSGRVK